MTFTEWLKTEWGKDADNMCPPPLDAQQAITFLKDYLLGEDWYSTMPMSTKQINTEIVGLILEKYSKRYRKERKGRKHGGVRMDAWRKLSNDKN